MPPHFGCDIHSANGSATPSKRDSDEPTKRDSPNPSKPITVPLYLGVTALQSTRPNPWQPDLAKKVSLGLPTSLNFSEGGTVSGAPSALCPALAVQRWIRVTSWQVPVPAGRSSFILEGLDGY